MSYIKNTWAKGDIVTAEKLNNIETGVFDALPLVIHEDQDGTLDVKANVIAAKMTAGHSCVIVSNQDGAVTQDAILVMRLDGDAFNCITAQQVIYTSSTAEGYPHRMTVG